MNKALLQSDVQAFIRNYSDDLSKLAFAGSPFEAISTRELIMQIESIRKAKSKLPSWYANHAIIYPPKNNLEQTSSELSAKYKSSLIEGEISREVSVLTPTFSRNISIRSVILKQMPPYPKSQPITLNNLGILLFVALLKMA